jgi:hypothetical protein
MWQRFLPLLPAFCVAVVLLGERVTRADPTHADPTAPFDVRTENEALVEKAAQIDEQIRALLQATGEKLAAGQILAIDPGQLHRTYALIAQLDRLGKQLLILGETAGEDLLLRTKQYRLDLSTVVATMKANPQVVARANRDQSALIRTATRHQNSLKSIGAIARRGEWEQAGNELYAIVDELSAMAMWYPRGTHDAVVKPFQSARETVDTQLTRRRVAAVQQGLGQTIEARMVNLDTLVGRVRDAAGQVRTGGSADLDGEMLNGPQLMERFGRQWRETRVVAMQCWALNASRRGATQGSSWSAVDQMMSQLSRFDQQMAAALVSLIEADAEQVVETQVRELYAAYLSVVAQLVAMSPDDALTSAALPALERLAQRSAALVGEIEAYRTATDDLLRWRRRTAESYAKVHAPQFPTLDDKLLEAIRADAHLRNLFPETAGRAAACGLGQPAPVLMEALSANLVGQNVTTPPLIGTATSQRFAASSCRNRQFVQLAVKDALLSELELLKAELLLSDSAEPLTLAAAAAVATAQRGDLVAAGGRIDSITMGSLLRRFAELSPLAWPLAASGSPPVEPTGSRPLRQVMFRFGMEPAWLQHEYFFVDLGGAPPAG